MALTIKPEFQNKVLGFNGSAIPLGQRSQVDLTVLLVLAYQSHRADYVNYFVDPPSLGELLGGGVPDGKNGWSPILTVQSAGTKRAFKVNDWTGGTGTKPASGKYVGANGLVDTIAEAVDISGGNAPLPFTELTSTVWDGKNRYKTLTANTALILETEEVSGIMYVKQDGTGGWTFSLNGQVFAIASGANADTAIGFLVVNGNYIFTVDTNVISVSATPPASIDTLPWIERWIADEYLNVTGVNVDSWYGKVHGAGAHIGAYDFQSSAPNQPTKQVGIFNGYDGIRFTSASTTYMSGVSINPAISVPITLFMAFKLNAIPAGAKYIQGASGGGVKGLLVDDSGRLGLYAGGSIVWSATTIAQNDKVVVAMEYTSAGSCKLYISNNSAAAILDSNFTGGADAGSSTTFQAPIMGETTIPADFDLAEFGILNAAYTPVEVAAYSAELAAKYF